jgi:hypothetical protein
MFLLYVNRDEHFRASKDVYVVFGWLLGVVRR